MKKHGNFGILGGDGRQLALAQSIASDGFEVYVCGFENMVACDSIHKATMQEIVDKCATVILPLPVTQDGVFLKTECSDERIPLNDRFAELLRGKQVFGGKVEKLYSSSEVWKSVDCRDYFAEEEFAVRNAAVTAECALGIAIKEYSGTVNGSSCLVTGFGRIGKALAWMLRGIGAKVTVSARKPSDLAWIESLGYRAVLTEKLYGSGRYEFIFNTVPAMVFNKNVLSNLIGIPLVIDLSSLPGGVDFNAAGEIGIHTIHALSLPGKMAPKAAAEIIKNTIYRMMGE